MPTRRQFIKSLGAALGAGVLTSAAGGLRPNPASAAPIPNAYSYSRLITSGASLPGDVTLNYISGTVTITDYGTVVFSGTDSAGATGLWEIQIADPASIRKLVGEGDELSNGVVDRVLVFDTNGLGSTAAIVQHDDGLGGVYKADQGMDFASVVRFNQELPGTSINFGAVFQDLVLHANDNLAVVGHYADRLTSSNHVGFFHLPQSQSNEMAYLILGSDGLLNGYEGDLSNLGLSDINHQGEYVIQAFGSQGTGVQVSSSGGDMSQGGGKMDTMLVSGNVYQRNKSGFSTMAWPQFPKPGGPPPSGEIIVGPRVDHQGSAAYVVHVSDERMSLVIQDRTIISTGDLAPAGWAVQSISPVNPEGGLYYYLLEGYSDHEQFQFMVHNGSEAKVILSMLDTIGDQRIVNLVWGMHTDQIDSSGRLVFLAEWDDQKTQSLLLATPV